VYALWPSPSSHKLKVIGTTTKIETPRGVNLSPPRERSVSLRTGREGSGQQFRETTKGKAL
jgi:hypothetical protein